MSMKVVTTIITTLLVLTTLLLSNQVTQAYPSYLCRADAKDVDVSKCEFGWYYDLCDVKTCAKGPRDHCGGRHNRYGVCGEGLMCSNCNRCQGCSLHTFECFHDNFCYSRAR
ncbi:neuroparsin-A [Lepeophtheirus salmonis]|uniref:neuroparsin-A n=1 Tax=Lepeophtheirus salmonis TaxID=72036 RepID=UPI001AEB1CA0|nr:neuroparsin-A-like [Lepeophtheirus salmonis]